MAKQNHREKSSNRPADEHHLIKLEKQGCRDRPQSAWASTAGNYYEAKKAEDPRGTVSGRVAPVAKNAKKGAAVNGAKISDI
jgi:hypothetical protein